MDPRLDRAFSSRRAVYGDQLNDGVIDHGKAVLLFLPDENSLGSVCVRRAFDRSSFFAFVKRDTRNSLQLVRHPAFFLLFFFRTWKIISPSRCVKRINKRVIPPDRDKSNRARSGQTTISNDFTRNYSFPSFFLFFFFPPSRHWKVAPIRLRIVRLRTYFRHTIIRYGTEEVVEPRSRRGSIRFSWKRAFRRRALTHVRWERGIWYIRNGALFPSIHPSKGRGNDRRWQWKREGNV